MKKLKDYKKLIDKGIFYDLGSGSGKVIFGAGLCFPFAKCKSSIIFRQGNLVSRVTLPRVHQYEKQNLSPEIANIRSRQLVHITI